MSTLVPCHPILPALVLVVLSLAWGGVEVSRWLREHHSAQDREEDQERRMRPVHWRLHARGIAIEQLAAGRFSLLEAAAWERVLDPQPRHGREGEDAEWYCRVMLRHLEESARVSERPEYAEALRRECAELDCLLAEFAPLALPEPPELPRLSP